jgi:4-amino-4-deoxy-L-arabinose transferase-like glycosyltransferase
MFKNKLNKSLLIVFVLLFLLQFFGGLFYCWSEYKNKPDVGFNPFVTGYDYIFMPGKDKAFGDMSAYNKFAYYLIEKGDFYNPNSGEKSAYVTPGLSLVLAIIYKIFGYGFIPVLIFHSLLVTLSYYILYLICLEIFNKKVATMTLILSFINIKLTYHLSTVLTEFLFIFLITLSLFILILILKKGRENIKYYIILGIILGYCTLVRPVIIPFIVILSIIFIYKKIKFKYIFITTSFIAFIISIWLIRNYLIFNSFIFSTGSMLGGLWIDFENYRNISFFTTYFLPMNDSNNPLLQQAIATCSGDPYFECFWRESSQYFNNWVSNNIWFYIKICIWRFKSLLLPFTQEMSMRNSIISTIVWLIIFVPSFYLMTKIKQNKFILIIFILSISLLIAPSLAGVDKYLRYQLPTQFLLIPFAAYFWVTILNKFKILVGK